MTKGATPIPPEASAFREGMSRLGAAVNLVTTDGPAGRHGLTVSAVCSVTDSPPTLLVCINRNAFAHDAFIANGVLSVNVLCDSHQNLSMSFARWTGEDRFGQALWEVRASGAPCLADASVSFDCRIADVHQHGTHSVLYCEVVDTRVRAGQPAGLIWFHRNFHPLEAC
ncbi:flavin reductase [Paracoccus sp. MKU1]|uniref:flavin reductase n=1 Tax=Paracoccus sp. MKU1 TaxID=1745182 RepID=UPI00071929F5|nr:flavin reductase [Paracoccus sp. MKU1]KRW95240.1 flavin reductase [Paracoccus sp. MKU1]